MVERDSEELVSTAELARRLGYSQSNVLKLERGGYIPRGITVVGWGRRVWKAEDIPNMQEALQRRVTRRAAASGVAA